jgi:HMG (high mobility group) box
MIYSQENRDRIKQDNPDAKMGDISKLLGDAYKKLGAEEKAELDKKVRICNVKET